MIQKDRGFVWVVAGGIVIASSVGVGLSTLGAVAVLTYVWREDMNLEASQAGWAPAILAGVWLFPGKFFLQALQKPAECRDPLTRCLSF